MVTAILGIGIPFAYLCGIGAAWALCPDRRRPREWEVLGTRGWAAVLWPLAIPVVLALFATRALIARRQRAMLPSARTVR